jgi:hypothetical protein
MSPLLERFRKNDGRSSAGRRRERPTVALPETVILKAIVFLKML